MSTSNPPKKHDRFASSRLIRRVTLTAVFTAFALVIKCYTKMVLTLPGIGVQISFGGIFTFFPAILFGPLYGGASSALLDFLGAMIAPSGAYIPLLTVTAFLGGCLKGLIWRWLKDGVGKRTKAGFLTAILLLGVIAVPFQVALHRDGIAQSLFIRQDDLPVKQEIYDRADDLSPLSRFLIKLAKYNKDTLTVNKVETLSLPVSAVTTEGPVALCLPTAASLVTGPVSETGEAVAPVSYTVKKLASGSLSDCVGCPIYIPDNYTDIADDAAKGADPARLSEWVIYGKEGSAAQTYAQKIGAKFTALVPTNAEGSATDRLTHTQGTSYLWEAQGCQVTFKSSDTYRKYLANYLTLATAGTELFSLLSLCLWGIVLLLRRVLPKKEETEGPGSASYLKILVTILLPGLIVTTLNTFVLRFFLPTYAGRAILILWIPRFCEELVVNVGQAYLISLLYGVIVRGRLKRLMEQL